MKCAILLVAYGAATPRSEVILRSFAAVTRERFSGIPVRWAFTSCRVRRRMTDARRKNDSVQKALEKFSFENFTHVIVQPLQIIPGKENADIVEEVCRIAKKTSLTIGLGKPLLASRRDIERIVDAVMAHLPRERREDEDVIFMGHGARHSAAVQYEELARAVYRRDPQVHIGTMNGAVVLNDIIPKLRSHRVWLLPLLSVIGRHALEDMAGRAPVSWHSRIEESGHECIPVLKGTAEYDAFIAVWLDHLSDALKETITPTVS